MLLQRHRLSVSLNGSLGGHSLVSGLHAPDAWRINGQGQALTAPAWSELDRCLGRPRSVFSISVVDRRTSVTEYLRSAEVALAEHRTDGALFMNAPDRFSQHVRDRQHLQLREHAV